MADTDADVGFNADGCVEASIFADSAANGNARCFWNERQTDPISREGLCMYERTFSYADRHKIEVCLA